MSADVPTAALGLAMAAVVPAVYSAALPELSTVHGSDDNAHLAAGQLYAGGICLALVLGVTAVTREPIALVTGIIALVGFHLAYNDARGADSWQS